MTYETYKLGKLQKYGVRKLYTHEELEQLDIPRLRDICNAENIKPPTLMTMNNKEELVELVYRYFGTVKQEGIYKYYSEAASRVKYKILDYGVEQSCVRIEIPSQLMIYKNFNSFDETDSGYEIIAANPRLGKFAFLTDGDNMVQAIVTLKAIERIHGFRLVLGKDMMDRTLKTGSFRDRYLILFLDEFMEDVIGIYHGLTKKSAIPYIRIRIPEVVVTEVQTTEEVLVIDYGTSYTTAGTYHHLTNTNRRIGFVSEFDCQPCELCPSVVAVKSCKDNKIEFIFGHEAIMEEQKRGYISKNSIFYDTKRWVNHYKEKIRVADFDGNSCEIERSMMVGAFLLFIIKAAEQQNKVKYKNICLTCPVKQKALSLKMYQDVLPNYNLQTKGMTDEAVAVMYHSLANQIEELRYESGQRKHVLILDCGGGTSDMVSCDYSITNLSITSRINMNIKYAHGDTNFGGNNLTYRILQYLKIRFAEFYTGASVMNIDHLLPEVLEDIYSFVDSKGLEKVYESFLGRYEWAESVIPTRFLANRNATETVFLRMKGNYYFLWHLAEKLKKELFDHAGIVQIPLLSFFDQKKEEHLYLDTFNLSVRNSKKIMETYIACPEFLIVKEEINLLLKPEIYNLIKNFIEPYYMAGMLDDIDQIYLSGQTSKIDLFREVLKEYIAGKKAKADSRNSCYKKFMCIDGAISYQGAKKMGRISSVIEYDSPLVPYSLTAPDFHGREREIYLIQEGTAMEDIYGFVSRFIETEEIIFTLKDKNEKILYDMIHKINCKNYQITTYEYLLNKYTKLLQRDIDSIIDGEVKLFVFSDNENWGFSVLEVARTEAGLCYETPKYIPFENTEWEINFFDGFH